MARPNKYAIPYVSLIRRHVDYNWEVMFTHPLLRKRVKRGLKTPIEDKARELADKLSAIIQNPDQWRALPKETPPIIRRIWEQEVWEPLPFSKEFGVKPRHEATQAQLLATSELQSSNPAVMNLAKMAKEQYNRVEAHNREMALLEENERMRMEIQSYRGIIKKAGLEEARVTTLPLDEAIKEFLESLAGVERTKNNIGYDLDAFAAAMRKNTKAGAITSDDVIKYLKGRKAEPERIKRVAGRIIRMLVRATGGVFKPQAVLDYVAANIASNSKPSEIPYWIEQKDVDALVSKLPEWLQEVALLQWASALRPEELARITWDSMTISKGCLSVRIQPTGDWKPKTERSVGVVNLPPWATQKLKHLVGRKSESGYLFDADGKPWELESWTKRYLSELREAAEQAKLDKDRMDSRTLRRSAGKRILLSELHRGVGNAIEITAAILRDHPNTVRKYYASLLPSDVQQH